MFRKKFWIKKLQLSHAAAAGTTEENGRSILGSDTYLAATVHNQHLKSSPEPFYISGKSQKKFTVFGN